MCGGGCPLDESPRTKSQGGKGVSAMRRLMFALALASLFVDGGSVARGRHRNLSNTELQGRSDPPFRRHRRHRVLSEMARDRRAHSLDHRRHAQCEFRHHGLRGRGRRGSRPRARAVGAACGSISTAITGRGRRFEVAFSIVQRGLFYAEGRTTSWISRPDGTTAPSPIRCASA